MGVSRESGSLVRDEKEILELLRAVRMLDGKRQRFDVVTI